MKKLFILQIIIFIVFLGFMFSHKGAINHGGVVAPSPMPMACPPGSHMVQINGCEVDSDSFKPTISTELPQYISSQSG